MAVLLQFTLQKNSCKLSSFQLFQLLSFNLHQIYIIWFRDYNESSLRYSQFDLGVSLLTKPTIYILNLFSVSDIIVYYTYFRLQGMHTAQLLFIVLTQAQRTIRIVLSCAIISVVFFLIFLPCCFWLFFSQFYFVVGFFSVKRRRVALVCHNYKSLWGVRCGEVFPSMTVCVCVCIVN